MSRKKKRRKLPGHYCWACDSRLPNEKFSGKGHARHLCRNCARLGAEELEFRSASRNLERCLTWEGFIRRKRRKQFERFLEHSNSRVRALAEEIRQNDLVLRAEHRKMREEDELALEEMCGNIGGQTREVEHVDDGTPETIPF